MHHTCNLKIFCLSLGSLHYEFSYGVSGIRGRSLIINLPGSPKAVRENLAVIEKAVVHAVDLLRGDVRTAAR